MEKAKNKLYHYQSTPHEEIWDRIAARLNVENKTERAEDKLYHYQQMPPEAIWDRIESQLGSESNTEKAESKLYHYQQTPPEAIWDRIDNELESGTSESVGNKLYNYKQTPPEGVWDKISTELDDDNKVVHLHHKSKFKRIAILSAVAASVALILINFVFINNPNSTTERQTALLLQKDSIIENHSLLESIIDAPEDEKLPISQTILEDETTKYLTVMGPNGDPVKISPKVATLIVSADGAFLPKPVWDKQIDDWQQIMLTSASSTSADLMDIVQQAASASFE